MRSREVALVAVMMTVPSWSASAAPRLVSGWPVPVKAGALHPGPAGGPVVISEGGTLFADGGPVSSVAAFRLNGKPRWISAIPWGCGNCDDGLHEPGLQLDGTYGPIGPEGDGSWNVDQDGSRVQGCPGLVRVTGTRICHEARLPPSAGAAIVARRGTTLLWEYVDPTSRWNITSDSNVPPVVFADATSAYTSFPRSLGPGRVPIPAQLLALDLADGKLRWRASEVVPVAALRDGVIGATGSALVSYAPDGTVRWTTPLPALTAPPSAVLSGPGGVAIRVDERSRRVYVPLARRQIVALDLATGAELWRTPPADRAHPLSVGSNGLLYVRIERNGRHALRAIGPDGKRRWQFDTTTPVAGASLLPGGTVALSTTEVDPVDRAGLLWRIDPRRAAPRVRTTRLSLTRTTFRAGCFSITCEYSEALGTVLRSALPTTGTLRVRIRRPDGSGPDDPLIVRAPAGVSYTRIYTWPFLTRGRWVIEIRGTVGTLPLTTRFPVVVR